MHKYVPLVLLILACTVSAQFQRQRQQRQRFRPQQRQSGADGNFGNSEYVFSWNHPNGGSRKWAYDGANNFCKSIGMLGVSINSQQENNYISNVIRNARIDYIWTSGDRRSGDWLWDDGNFQHVGWSDRGGFGRVPQPDNREQRQGGRPEECLAVLNNFYRDGVKWHDVECSHTKPIICEKRAG